MMSFVALVEYIRHHVWWWRIDDSRGNNVWHVPKVLVLRDVHLLV